MDRTSALTYVREEMKRDNQYKMVIGRMATHVWLESRLAEDNTIDGMWEEELLVNTNDVDLFLNAMKYYGWFVERHPGFMGATTFIIQLGY